MRSPPLPKQRATLPDPRPTPPPARCGICRAWRHAASPLALLIAWQAAASYGLAPLRLISSPAIVFSTLIGLIADGTLPRHLLVSLARVAVGMTIGASAGIVLALISGLSRRGEAAIDAPLQMIRTLPHLALVPLLILWLGIGEAPKIALVALGSLFPVYLNLFAGIRGVDRKQVELGRVLELSRPAMLRHIILPAALPSLLTGLRYAGGVAWLSLVVGEQINADAGIGYMMMEARDFLRTDIIMVGLLVYALLGLATDLAVRRLERAALSWRPTLLESS